MDYIEAHEVYFVTPAPTLRGITTVRETTGDNVRPRG
jgi:hypothetical protein